MSAAIAISHPATPGSGNASDDTATSTRSLTESEGHREKHDLGACGVGRDGKLDGVSEELQTVDRKQIARMSIPRLSTEVWLDR